MVGRNHYDPIGFKVVIPEFDSRSDITTIRRTGKDVSVVIQLESGTEDFDGVSNVDGNEFRLVQESGVKLTSNDSDGRNAEGKHEATFRPNRC